MNLQRDILIRPVDPSLARAHDLEGLSQASLLNPDILDGLIRQLQVLADPSLQLFSFTFFLPWI